nr:RNA-directed DNA polymerase, eukaryota [Tanacetum cinerariifolium]
MNRYAFRTLCEILETRGGLSCSKHMKVDEKVAMFLHTLAHNEKNYIIVNRFQRSGETISPYFRLVLNAEGSAADSRVLRDAISRPNGIKLTMASQGWSDRRDSLANDMYKEWNARPGSSGGILCVCEATIFKKDYATVSDNFIAIYGTWISNNSKIGIVKRISLLVQTALIPKVTDAKFVIDFRPISLIGCVYKVVTKILANRLAMVISDLVFDIQSAFVANRQILDVPLILNDLLAWCKRKKKQAMIFKVDFAKAEWSDSNLDNIVKILKCFFLASGLKINIQKSQVLGVGVPRNIVNQAASLIGVVMQNPFRYLGVMVGDSMSRKLALADTVQKLRSRLSKWKPLRVRFPRLFALETDKESTVASKLGSSSVDASFRRSVRDGVERQ